MQLWTQAAMNAKELLVHDGGERKSTEGFDSGIVNLL
jgi:hypothetical protein